MDYNTDSYRESIKKRTALAAFLIIGVLLTAVEIIYRIRIVPKRIHFIYGWMEILMIGIILFCFICSAFSYIHIDKKKKRAVIITAAVLCSIPALILSIAGTKTIVKFSPDKKHVLAVDRNDGNTVVNNTYYYIFKSTKEQLPYTVDGKMKYQWLADDICAITYNSTDDSNTHQYIQTFGDRGDGISYNDPFTAVSGSWQIADQNHAGWQLKVENGCITIKNGSNVWSYQSSDCVRFGTCAMVLCKGGIPEWSLALNPDCRINYDCLIANGGTITLCRVLIDETTTFTFECTDAKEDYSDVNPSLNDNTAADDNVEIEDTIHKMQEFAESKNDGCSTNNQYGIFYVDSDSSEENWNVFAAVKRYAEDFRINGVDVRCQIKSIERLAGDKNDGYYEVVYNELCISPGNQGAAPEGEKAEFTQRIRMIKAEKGYYACVFSYSQDGSYGLSKSESEKTDLSDNDEYHFFLSGQYDESYMYTARKSPKQGLEELYQDKLSEGYPDGIETEFDDMDCIDLKGDGSEYLIYDGISEDYKNYSYIRVKLKEYGLSLFSRMTIEEYYTIGISND